MGVKVAATCLHLSQTLPLHPPPSSHAYSYHSLASSSASSSSPSVPSSPVSSAGSRRQQRRRSFGGLEKPVSCRILHLADRTSFLGGGPGGLLRSRSCDMFSRLDAEPDTTLRRVVSATLADSFFSDGDNDEEEDFARRLQDLALRCQEDAAALDDAFLAENFGDGRGPGEASADNLRFRDWDDASLGVGISAPQFLSGNGQASSAKGPATPPPWLGVRPEPPDWVEEARREILPGAVSVGRNAASVDLPLSLRILKQKKRGESEGWIREASETAACSVEKALSSLVFIIRELQSYALQLRFGDDSLQEILYRVHREVHASFCWLFGHIFASTPTLMVSVMLLLANFTVYSMSNSVAVAAPPMAAVSQLQSPSSAMIATFVVAEESRQAAVAPPAESFSVDWHGGGGGSKGGRVAGASDDGRWVDGPSLLDQRGTVLPEAVEERGTPMVPVEEESRVWKMIVEEAARMRSANEEEALMDPETLRHFVAPVVAEVAPDEDYQDYLRTELMYQQALGQDPTNAMLLGNFAQFLYVVSRDHDRAEYYFKRAAEIQPPDAEALGRYASFLWLAKSDLGAAEEAYLDAIAADPGNTAHAANYAHFLWNTGGEDTCYPLDDLDDEYEEGLEMET